MATWSKDTILEFIETYKSIECLWKVASSDYADRLKRERGYEELVYLCKEFYPKANKDFVLKKINNLRTSFRKELLRQERSKRAAKKPEDVYTPRLWYFKNMLFLVGQEGHKLSDLRDRQTGGLSDLRERQATGRSKLTDGHSDHRDRQDGCSSQNGIVQETAANGLEQETVANGFGKETAANGFGKETAANGLEQETVANGHINLQDEKTSSQIGLLDMEVEEEEEEVESGESEGESGGESDGETEDPPSSPPTSCAGPVPIRATQVKREHVDGPTTSKRKPECVDGPTPSKQRCAEPVRAPQPPNAGDDHHDVFGKHVAHILRTLSREQRIFAEKIISDALFEAQLGALSRDASIVTQKQS